MAIIPDMDLETAQSALNSEIRRRIDDDLKHNSCIWCKSGSGKKKKHPLIDCPNARPAPDGRTAFSNEVFNTGQGDAAIAYIHHLQLRQYPRSDGATTFLAGRHRAQMAMFVRPVATQAPPAPVPPVNTPTVPVPPAPTASTKATTSTPAAVDKVPSTLPTAMNSLSLGNPTPAPSATSQAITSASVPSVPIKDSPPISWTNHVPYDQATNAPPPAAYGTGNQFNPGTGVIKKVAPLKDKMKHPVRDRLNDDKRHSVLTNHFEVAIDPKAKFYEYRIVGIPESEKRATKKRIMDTVIDNVPFLRNNQASFATDYVDTIIAWKDIRSLATGPKVGSYDPTIPDSRDEWRILEVVDRNVTLYLNLRLIGLVGIEQFQRYIASEHSNPPAYDPEPTKNALNIIFTKCFGSSPSVRQLNSHKFYVTDALMDMKTFRDQTWPLRALRGYYYTIKAGMGKILLNVSTANSLFWNPQPVSDVLSGGLGTFGGDRYALKGVQVYIRYDRGKNAEARSSDLNARHNRVKKIRGFGKALNVQEFDLHTKDAQGNITSTRRTTVADYLERTYNKTLKFKKLAAVDLSVAGEPSWFAPEDLDIIPGQIWAKIVPDAIANDFHSLACLGPRENRARIEREGLTQLTRNVSALPGGTNTHNQFAPLAGCPFIQLNPTMLQIPASRMPYATVEYRNGSNGQWSKTSGRWNLARQRFIRGSANGVRWKLLQASGVDPRAVTEYIRHFNGQLESTGVCPQNGATHIGQTAVALRNLSESELSNQLQTLLQDRGNGIPDIVVLLLKNSDQQAYSSFKYLADKIFCIQAICAVERSFKPAPRGGGWDNANSMEQYMANVAMKANLKMRGLNHTVRGVDGPLRNTLILGADITHPGAGAVDACPSIAAVVGSVEDHTGRFRGELSLQTNIDMVEHFQKMVERLLVAWYDQPQHGKFPANVLYYRDGIAKSQYAELEQTEIPAIRNAFEKVAKDKKVAATPFKLTTVIVTKRHNTRLFPSTEKDAMNKNDNCHPGTLVDNAITDPYFSDFYLQSHNAIKGTARPCHYYVLKNEIGMNMGQLEQFTHELCHTYVRATMGVSYAPPAYYADRLCERGRCYMRPWYNPNEVDKKRWAKRKRHYEDVVRTERDAKNKRAGRPQRQHGHKKTALETKEEDEDETDANTRLYKELIKEIEARFNAECIAPNAQIRKDRLVDTMYWM